MELIRIAYVGKDGEEHYARIGAKGGKTARLRPFAADPALARRAGKLGGSKKHPNKGFGSKAGK